MKYVRLSSGFDMPIVGLGTWQSTPEEIENAVDSALEHGYRHIDTANVYQNEEAIGKSLKKWFDKGGKREELFITTKLPPHANRPSDVENYIKLSLNRLQLDYLDMYLVHVPFSFIKNPDQDAPALEPDGSPKLELNSSHVAVWKEMEKQVRNGNARSIGLSNFNESQVTEVWQNAEIKPSNLQIELHAYHQQRPLRELCKKYNIAVTSYSTLGSPGAKAFYRKDFDPEKFPGLLEHPVVKKIANSHNKSMAQVLLRHLIQQGVLVIPKSTSSQRIKANIQLFDFELTKDEMSQLDALDQGKEGKVFDFLIFKGVEKHPHYPF